MYDVLKSILFPTDFCDFQASEIADRLINEMSGKQLYIGVDNFESLNAR